MIPVVADEHAPVSPNVHMGNVGQTCLRIDLHPESMLADTFVQVPDVYLVVFDQLPDVPAASYYVAKRKPTGVDVCEQHRLFPANTVAKMLDNRSIFLAPLQQFGSKIPVARHDIIAVQKEIVIRLIGEILWSNPDDLVRRRDSLKEPLREMLRRSTASPCLLYSQSSVGCQMGDDPRQLVGGVPLSPLVGCAGIEDGSYTHDRVPPVPPVGPDDGKSRRACQTVVQVRHLPDHLQAQ